MHTKLLTLVDIRGPDISSLIDFSVANVGYSVKLMYKQQNTHQIRNTANTLITDNTCSTAYNTRTNDVGKMEQ